MSGAKVEKYRKVVTSTQLFQKRQNKTQVLMIYNYIQYMYIVPLTVPGHEVSTSIFKGQKVHLFIVRD